MPGNGKIEKVDLEYLQNIMYLTALRGNDSTGIAVVSEGKTKPRTMKTVGGPDFLINHDAFQKILEFATKKGVAMFGHGRASTMGSIVAKNAHPHTVDHITLVHNGTLRKGVEDEMKLLGTENDSHALCSLIAKKGLVDALYDVEGAYALIVHDAKEECIYVVRNSERPLHLAEYMGISFIMSEADALKYLVSRSTFTNYTPKIEYFNQNVIFKFDIKTGKHTTDNSLVDKLAKKFKPPVVPTFKAGYHGPATASTETSGGTSTSIKYPNGRRLLLSKITKMEKGETYRLEFLDPEHKPVIAITPKNVDDKLGEYAYAFEIGEIRDNFKKEVTKFTRFKELKWEQPQVPEKEDEPGKLVRFRNGQQRTLEQAKRIIDGTDCGLCCGVVRETEIEQTILTGDNGLICPDCIKQGRHFAFGFGQ